MDSNWYPGMPKTVFGKYICTCHSRLSIFRHFLALIYTCLNIYSYGLIVQGLGIPNEHSKYEVSFSRVHIKSMSVILFMYTWVPDKKNNIFAYFVTDKLRREKIIHFTIEMQIHNCNIQISLKYII